MYISCIHMYIYYIILQTTLSDGTMVIPTALSLVEVRRFELASLAPARQGMKWDNYPLEMLATTSESMFHNSSEATCAWQRQLH